MKTKSFIGVGGFRKDVGQGARSVSVGAGAQRRREAAKSQLTRSSRKVWTKSLRRFW